MKKLRYIIFPFLLVLFFSKSFAGAPNNFTSSKKQSFEVKASQTIHFDLEDNDVYQTKIRFNQQGLISFASIKGAVVNSLIDLFDISQPFPLLSPSKRRSFIGVFRI